MHACLDIVSSIMLTAFFAASNSRLSLTYLDDVEGHSYVTADGKIHLMSNKQRIIIQRQDILTPNVFVNCEQLLKTFGLKRPAFE